MVRRGKNSPIVISKTEGSLSRIDPEKWTRIENLDALVRPTLEQSFSKAQAEQIARQLGVHWGTVYRYRRRLLDQGVATGGHADFRRDPRACLRIRRC